MKYHIITYGCQMNKSDSERIAAILDSIGCMPAASQKEAGLLLVNSCSVRQSAINRIYGVLKNLKSASTADLPKRREIKTILTGCILESDKKKFANKFDLIIDIKELTKNPQKLIESLNISNEEFKAFDYTDYFKINPQYRSNFSAYIPIMTGCNNFCSYCAVPYTRGREMSRLAEEIMAEVKRLVKKKYKEITLLGQNVNSYISQIPNNNPEYSEQITNKSFFSVIASFPSSRRKAWQSLNSHTTQKIASVVSLPRNDKKNQLPIKNKQINFPELLKQINDIPGDFWIRFLTSHPKDISDELIETMAKYEKVCEYIHLPIQSGDDEILRKMNRRYNSTHYLKLIKKIRQVYDLEDLETKFPSGNLVSKSAKNSPSKIWHPPVAISTDIIVGFPGETKKQFENTAKIMEKVKFDMAYLAEYSPRPGTSAAKLKDNVPILEKKRRKKILNDILKKTALANNKKYIGKTVQVLIEKIDDNFLYGKTRTFKNVRISLPVIARSEATKQSQNTPNAKEIASLTLAMTKIKTGQFLKVKITKASVWGLEGEIL
ncbi:MiaB/RimO family radical SAM methylthiotransferase [Patescibacteria group bacterium]|nr:MiaB/RimO family radical SAM methylthiotransferase [Patescibacteria group bacterium]